MYINELKDFFKHYLYLCIKRKELSADEIEDIKYLKEMLKQYNINATELINEVVMKIYNRELEQLSKSEDKIDNEEYEFLNKL